MRNRPKKMGLLSRTAINKLSRAITNTEIPVLEESDLYMSFVVTDEQRAIIEDALAEQDGNNLTEQLICLIEKRKKKKRI